jgi:hypothetical protein
MSPAPALTLCRACCAVPAVERRPGGGQLGRGAGARVYAFVGGCLLGRACACLMVQSV